MYVIPAFPLACNVWRWADVKSDFTVLHGSSWPPGGGPEIANVPCNLVWGRNVADLGGEVGGADYPAGVYMTLLLPAKSDIRSGSVTGTPGDIIECPAGSGRVYLVMFVDDVGKGFANEHRAALILQWGFDQSITDATDSVGYYGVGWPAPIP